jgi:5-methylcytosine-specific restriction endonuclease McrA
VGLGKNQKPKISIEEMRSGIASSMSWSELARLLRGNSSWGNVRTLKRYVAHYNLDTSHFANYSPAKPRQDWRVEDVFIENSPASNTVLVKRYRILFPAEKCAECGTGTVWNGKPLTLHIDHINGHGTDWRLENCRYLCPNCHYQTDTHGTKRGLLKRVDEIRVTPSDLSESFEIHQCYKTVGLIYGLSDRTVKNMIRKYRKGWYK